MIMHSILPPLPTYYELLLKFPRLDNHTALGDAVEGQGSAIRELPHRSLESSPLHCACNTTFKLISNPSTYPFLVLRPACFHDLHMSCFARRSLGFSRPQHAKQLASGHGGNRKQGRGLTLARCCIHAKPVRTDALMSLLQAGQAFLLCLLILSSLTTGRNQRNHILGVCDVSQPFSKWFPTSPENKCYRKLGLRHCISRERAAPS